VSGRNKGAGFHRTGSDHMIAEKRPNIECLKSHPPYLLVSLHVFICREGFSPPPSAPYLGTEAFFPNHFQFILHKSFSCSTLYSGDNGSIGKLPTKTKTK
jgi:hypothetical protein